MKNKLIISAVVLAVLQIVQSEVLSLAVFAVALFAFVFWLMKQAAERN